MRRPPPLGVAVKKILIDLRSADEASLASIPTLDLLVALSDSDLEVRAIAVYALGTRGEESAISALVNSLGNSGAFLARTAADALTRIGKPAVSALTDALKHPDAQTRGLAARALAHIKDPSSIPALFNALEDDSAFVQYWADEGLDRLGVGQIYFKP